MGEGYKPWERGEERMATQDVNNQSTFERSVENAALKGAADILRKDTELVAELESQNFPDDEGTLTAIAEKHDLGAPQVGALSQRLREEDEFSKQKKAA